MRVLLCCFCLSPFAKTVSQHAAPETQPHSAPCKLHWKLSKSAPRKLSQNCTLTVVASSIIAKYIQPWSSHACQRSRKARAACLCAVRHTHLSGHNARGLVSETLLSQTCVLAVHLAPQVCAQCVKVMFSVTTRNNCQSTVLK